MSPCLHSVFISIFFVLVLTIISIHCLHISENNLSQFRNAEQNIQQGISVADESKQENNSRIRVKRADDKPCFIDRGYNYPQHLNPSKQQNARVTVEILLVCDKEFGDIFKHDRRRILDYFTVYFYDVSQRYKTLRSSDISFRIIGVKIINDRRDQLFIEHARVQGGRVELTHVLPAFATWVYTQLHSLPKFDIAIAITNAQLTWNGGLAYLGEACHVDHEYKRYGGTLVWRDDGTFNSVTVGAHEIGHILGAKHDDDPTLPGGCREKGYVMHQQYGENRWFFSSCSDRQIGDFVRSDRADCLRRLDATSRTLPISPGFTDVSAPSMLEQCRRRLNSPLANISEEDTENCRLLRCELPHHGGWALYSLGPVDSTPCRGGRRCFRGECKNIIIPSNVGSTASTVRSQSTSGTGGADYLPTVKSASQRLLSLYTLKYLSVFIFSVIRLDNIILAYMCNL